MKGAHTMQRRDLLIHGAALATTAAAAPAFAKPAQASAFAKAVLAQPLMAPFKGVDDLTGDVDGTALMRGRWPSELRGRFYRNGPALASVTTTGLTVTAWCSNSRWATAASPTKAVWCAPPNCVPNNKRGAF
jgi:hypothetical protein